MADITISMAQDATDFDVARALSMEWLDWHWRHYPSDWPHGTNHPMDRRRFEAIVEQLPILHERPLGGIIIGSLDGQPAGCVMYSGAEGSTGVAEFNRMFVRETGRGYGIGRKMLDAMFLQQIADGYRKVFFSSATFLTHARAMYEAAGFVDIPHPEGFPEAFRKHVYFMERDLL